MASDLPNRHASSHAMARSLATYMDDPVAIRRAVLECFYGAPSVYEIREMRKRHLKPKVSAPAIRANEGYYPDHARDVAGEKSRLFLQRLEAERAASRAAHNQALNSPYLTQPALVNRRWESEVAAARIVAGEGQQGADAA